MTAENKKSIVKIFTATAVILFILLFAALIINIVKLTTASKNKAQLEEQIIHLDSIISSNDNDIAFKNTDDYIDQYAREYLNMQGKNEITFIGK